eukprot:CAMPEP_0194302490 /NCGR_PEP_ID=MMETSP0171-20130528/289_1 /TAXON_ID=218684 /ORGANISM="Corethron pennatum, Strain L29A3" /LENGTH=374 /DNA_ID=CAMNT_0039052927 /DNA_START=243 /DNA_END=1363 /DNA_ORIENTATION=+
MSVYSCDEECSVENSYGDDYSAVCSTHSPPHSPSSYYETNGHPGNGPSSPPPAGPNFNFYGETQVLIDTTRPPAITIRRPDVDEADCQSQHDCDSVKSNFDDDSVKSNFDDEKPPDTVKDNGAPNVTRVNYVDETNFAHFAQPVVQKKFPTSWGRQLSHPKENQNLFPRSNPPVHSLPSPPTSVTTAPDVLPWLKPGVILAPWLKAAEQEYNSPPPRFNPTAYVPTKWLKDPGQKCMRLSPEWHRYQMRGTTPKIQEEERKHYLHHNQLDAPRKSSLLKFVYEHLEELQQTETKKILRDKVYNNSTLILSKNRLSAPANEASNGTPVPSSEDMTSGVAYNATNLLSNAKISGAALQFPANVKCSGPVSVPVKIS